MKRKNYHFIKILLLSLLISGCATAEYRPTQIVIPSRKGVYHKVRKGETLWRIAKAYNVGINKIIRSNNIPNVAHVVENQLVFIPGASAVRTIPLDQNNLDKNEFIWPIKGKILSYFGQRGSRGFNKGIWIQASTGDNVHAAREGRVVFADHLSGYDETIILDHGDGYYSIYAQNASLAVKSGDYVFRGDPVAKVGRSGKLAFLHFEIRKNSIADNPLYYLP